MVEDERRVAAGSQKMLFGRNLAEVLIAGRADEGEMAMTLDHARHQGHAASVDDLGAVAAKLAFVARDRGDAVMLDQHLGRITLIVLAIPDLRVLNQKGHQCSSSLLQRRGNALYRHDRGMAGVKSNAFRGPYGVRRDSGAAREI